MNLLRHAYLAASLLVGLNAPAMAERISISSITDGDTVRIGKERIRIANIDAPELNKPRCDAERRLAVLAKKRLATLLSNGEIVIKRGDPQDGRLKDWRGRTLATVTVDGRDVGDILIDEGLARPWKGRREPWCNQ